IATNIVRTWKSSYDRTKLADNLKKLFAYMQTEGKVNYTDFERLMSEVARPVVVESYVEDEINKANYDEFRKAIKSYRFTLSDEQKKELAYVSGSANEFRKKNIAYLTIVNEGGVNINDVWSEITTTARECGITWLDYVDSDKDQINLDAPPTMVYRATTLGQTYIQIRENHRIFIPKKYRSSIKNV
ncbi:MAG: hypothetical protein HUJ71_08145, partial [Pseudobutyrivibrio sp.]|nr:hypothetical protein [Pseudobutyrivibrio sp.]